MVYENCKIYGPYQAKDKRFRIIVYFSDGQKCTVSYPKYLMEIRANRYLENYETVDHLNGDVTDNRYENLCIKDRRQHIVEDVKRVKPQEFKCPECGKSFILSEKKLRYAIDNRSKGKAGPFCSRSCSGKYTSGIQWGKRKRLHVKKVKVEYYTYKKEREMIEIY